MKEHLFQETVFKRWLGIPQTERVVSTMRGVKEGWLIVTTEEMEESSGDREARPPVDRPGTFVLAVGL